MGARKRTLAWIGSSRKDLLALSIDLRRFFGHALDCARRGEPHETTRMMKGFDGNVWQIVKTERDTTYRTVYAVQSNDIVQVLYCSCRKNKRPRP